MTDPLNDANAIAELRRAKEALEGALAAMTKSEEQFRTMLSKIPTLVWRTTADGYAEFFSQPWYDYTGISVEDALGAGWTAAFHPDDLQALSARWTEIVASEKPSEVEARFRRYDGEYRWHLMRSVPVFDDHGKVAYWCGTNTDIDDLKRAETFLAGEKKLFEMSAKGDSLAAILDALCRVVEELSEGSLTSIFLLDEEGERLRHGAGPSLPESFMKAIDGKLIGPFGGPCVRAAFLGKKVFASDIATERLPDGYRALALQHDLRACFSTPIMSTGGKVLGVFGLHSRQARDITSREISITEQFTHIASILIERKRSEDALAKSEAFLAEGQRISKTGSWAWNVSTGKIVWSQEHCRIFGFGLNQSNVTVGLFFQTVHPADLAGVQAILDDAVRRGCEFSLDYRIILQDGAVKFIHGSAYPAFTESGELVEFIGAVRDVTEQIKAESALENALAKVRESEGQLWTIINTIPTLAWRTKADGYAEFYSQRWFDYTGLSFDEAKGHGWTAAIHPDDLRMIFDRWMEIMASEKPGEVEARFKRYDGEYRWHLFRTAPVSDGQGRILNWYGTNTDIEDLKRAEGELRRSKIYLLNAQKLSHTGSVGLRLSDGQIFWSEETARIYGYDPALQPTMEMVLQRVHPEDVEVLSQVFGRAMHGGASFDFEHRLLMPDGSVKYLRNVAHSVIDDMGNEEVLGVVTDITEQRQANAALEEALARIKKSEDQLQTTIDTIPTLVWSSPEDGVGNFFSKRWLDYTGLSHEEAQGTGWVVAIHPDDLGTLTGTWTKIRASGKEGGLEARLRRFDGVYRWFLFRAAPLRGPTTNDVVWYGTNTDIEDLKQAEAELRRREADLRKAQAELAHVTRVTTMGELAASIAHEVNQPIAGIVLNSNACMRWLARLKEEPATLAAAREALQRIIRDGTRAGEVISRIRALFKKTETAKEALDINEVIREVIVLSRSEMEKRRVTLRLDVAPDLPRVLGDRVQLQQVMINLILNGIEAMSAVEGRSREMIVGTHVHQEGQVLVTVCDSGVGFDPASTEQLFAAFYTTKPGGLGMGLSISRSIVENHGGRLLGSPNAGPGATFQFTILAHPAMASSEAGA